VSSAFTFQSSSPMARYYLHVRERSSALLQDPDGQELDDLASAKSEAIESARDLMAECLRSGRPLGLDRTMVVADENGATVAEVSFEAALPDDLSR
jgi:hypothetical protein